MQLRPIIKAHPKENVVWLWGREAPKYFGVRFNISAVDEKTDFKCGKHLPLAVSWS